MSVVFDTGLAIFCGLVASGVFAIGVYYRQQYRYYKHLKRPFDNQQFVTYKKGSPTNPIQNITLTVRGNKIEFNGKTLAKPNDPFNGIYVINPISLNFGEGFHAHDESEGFGFHKMIIKDSETFYVEAPYTKGATNEKIHQAFIWKKEPHRPTV